MIGRRGKLLILLYVVFLIVLFLMCSTDLIIREPEKEVYQIAVIIEDVRDDNYGNFKKGMDQAAMELNADVHFITLYEKMDADQQMELMGREQQDGADALIVVPADEERVVGALADGRITVPTVLVGSGLTGEKTAGIIAADYKEMGRRLAEEIMEKGDENCQVLIFEDPRKRSVMSRLFLEGAKGTFEERGRIWKSAVRQREGGGFEHAVEELWNQEGHQTALLAETPEILAETAALLAENPGLLEGTGSPGPGEAKPEALTGEEEPSGQTGMAGGTLGGGKVLGLYGRGSTLSVLNYLDRGLIAGICVTDEYSAGYLGVDMAVKALEGGGSRTWVDMDSWYIEKEDLRKPEYEKLLFPVE